MKEVEFIVEILPEDKPVAGNAIWSGDTHYDQCVERKILDDLVGGNAWAWCSVKVTARVDGIEGTDYLGGCSHANRQDFLNSEICEGMKLIALSELRNKLSGLVGIVKRTIEEVSNE